MHKIYFWDLQDIHWYWNDSQRNTYFDSLSLVAKLFPTTCGVSAEIWTSFVEYFLMQYSIGDIGVSSLAYLYRPWSEAELSNLKRCRWCFSRSMVTCQVCFLVIFCKFWLKADFLWITCISPCAMLYIWLVCIGLVTCSTNNRSDTVQFRWNLISCEPVFSLMKHHEGLTVSYQDTFLSSISVALWKLSAAMHAALCLFLSLNRDSGMV